jgi:alpha-D-ribose 1-methylphosphonate 5-triphosphate synthase subunit PhnG
MFGGNPNGSPTSEESGSSSCIDSAELQEARRRWLGVLCQASESELGEAWQQSGCGCEWQFLKKPEVVLVMVSGRAGGDGQTFHVGEATAARCVVEMGEPPVVGYGCVLGRSMLRAALVSLMDAWLQRLWLDGGDWIPHLSQMAQRQREADAAIAAEVASTKVDFFTMVRGE